jgi:hypothetical protein
MQRSIASLSGLLNSIQDVLNKDPTTTETFRSLHPYPMAPFNFEEPDMAGLANVILRKKPDVPDEKWIYDRLAKAQEFAHVPSDWDIELRKPPKDDEHSDDGEGEEAKDSIKAMFKRTRGTLDEDQIAGLWHIASDVMEEAMGNVGSGSADQSGSESEASSPEDTTMGGTDADKTADAAEKAEQRPPPMPLEIIQKFMATGMV